MNYSNTNITDYNTPKQPTVYLPYIYATKHTQLNSQTSTGTMLTPLLKEVSAFIHENSGRLPSRLVLNDQSKLLQIINRKKRRAQEHSGYTTNPLKELYRNKSTTNRRIPINNLCYGHTELDTNPTPKLSKIIYKCRSKTRNTNGNILPYKKCSTSKDLFNLYKSNIRVRKHSEQNYFNDAAISQLKRAIYKSRYVIYLNNHNIINNMKTFLADPSRQLTQHDTEHILLLIKYYESRIQCEEYTE